MHRNPVKFIAVMAICLTSFAAWAAQKPLVFMPFSKGESWYIVQGPGGSFSHTGNLSAAFDWQYTNNSSTFGHPVYSPIKGVVTYVRNDISDYVNNSGYTAANSNGLGNNLFIYDAATNKYVRMLHFQKGSITVKVGDSVNIGTYIGKIGMTGFTTNPHIHMQVQADNISGGKSIPFGYVEGLGTVHTWLTCGITPKASVFDSDGSLNLGHSFGTAIRGMSGLWSVSNWSGTGFTGDDYNVCQYNTQSCMNIWQFTVKEAGTYKILVRWKPADNRDPQTKYTTLGTVSYVNQKSGGDWYLLKTAVLSTNTYYTVKLDGTTKGTYVVADALMIIKQ